AVGDRVAQVADIQLLTHFLTPEKRGRVRKKRETGHNETRAGTYLHQSPASGSRYARATGTKLKRAASVGHPLPRHFPSHFGERRCLFPGLFLCVGPACLPSRILAGCTAGQGPCPPLA